MNIIKDQLVKIIELCWGAASDAKIDCGPMNVTRADGTNYTDQFGLPILNQQRVNIFQNMVACLTPKHQANTIEQKEPKEPWQEGEE